MKILLSVLRWSSGPRNAIRKHQVLAITLVSIAQLSLVGCYPVRSKNAIIGSYELGSGNDHIGLKIRQDGHFEESIKMGNLVNRMEGRWYWKQGALSLDPLWIPRAFAPEDLVERDYDSGKADPKYTLPGNWAFFPESHWGRIVLPVFEGVEFIKVNSSGADASR